MERQLATLRSRPAESEITTAQCGLSRTPSPIDSRPVAEILDDAENRGEIVSHAKRLILAMTPATVEQRAEVIYRTLNHYDSFARRSEVDKQMLIEDWLESLDKYPLEMLKAMARRWRDTDSKGFMPTISQFTDMLPPEMVDRFSLLYRAKRVSEQDWFE